MIGKIKIVTSDRQKYTLLLCFVYYPFLFHLIYETTEMTIYKFSLGSKYKKISIIFHESIIPLITKGTIILCATKKKKMLLLKL